MEDIRAVANEILALGGGEVDPLKLQKLLYYVQVYSVILHDEPVFSAQIQAWKDGPVNRDIWDLYKRFSRGPITDSPGTLRPKHGRTLTVIALVMLTFGNLSGSDLSGLTHKERPWVEAFAQGQNTEITMNLIKSGYVQIGNKVHALPTTQETIPTEIQQLLDRLRPDRDNEETVLEIADQNYSLLTDLVLTHAESVDYRIMADLVRGIAAEWPLHPEAAERALLTSLDRPEAMIQREALRGLDEMWREGHHELAPLVAHQALAVPKPRWAVMNG